MFWIFIVNLCMTPFIYFQNYKSYNLLSALGLFAILFVVGTIVMCCALMDGGDDNIPNTVEGFNVG